MMELVGVFPAVVAAFILLFCSRGLLTAAVGQLNAERAPWKRRPAIDNNRPALLMELKPLSLSTGRVLASMTPLLSFTIVELLAIFRA